MIPNTIEGYSISSRDIEDTTLIGGIFSSWAGVDANRPEEFTKMQSSGDNIILAGIIYEGIKNTTLQAWQYGLDGSSWNYFEARYENRDFNIAWQYSNQEDGDTIYSFDGAYNITDNLSIKTAYNRVSGTVSNGFGGGPFFTSSEDHTIHETLNGEAKLFGGEYIINRLRLSLTHVDFNRGEDETDYLLSYEFSDNLTLDFIYSNMNHDGDMSRFFINYKF